MLRTIFVAAIISIGLLGAVRSRFASLRLYVWFALFRPQEWVWIDLSAYRFSTVLGALLVVPCLFSGIWPLIAHPLSVGTLGFLGTGLIAQMGATDPAVGWEWIDFLAKLVLVCLLAIRLTNTPGRLVLLIGTVAWSFGFHPVKAGIGALLVGGARYFEGVGGAFADNNTYAVGCVTALPLLIAFAQNARTRWVRRLTWAAVPFTIVTIISTFSRGGLLSLSASVLVWILLQKRPSLLLTCTVTLLPLLFFVNLPSGYSDRMTTISTYEQVGDDSALGRLHFWRVALDMAKDRPLGVGLWNFQSTYDQYDFSDGQYGTGRAVHNSHLQVLTETGWLGAVCWVGLFAVAFFEAFRAKRRALGMLPDDARLTITVANGLIVSMSGFLVGGTFVSMALNELTWLAFALVACLDRLSLELVMGSPSAPVTASLLPLSPASGALVGSR